jgi:hypothetical protein
MQQQEEQASPQQLEKEGKGEGKEGKKEESTEKEEGKEEETVAPTQQSEEQPKAQPQPQHCDLPGAADGGGNKQQPTGPSSRCDPVGLHDICINERACPVPITSNVQSLLTCFC